MAKVLTPEQFRDCPRGTVFSFGPKWAFGSMLILDEILGPFEGGAWGFYATDPMWVESHDLGEAADILERMITLGVSAPIEKFSTKYMSYDGTEMEAFLVLEASDWEILTGVANFSISKD